MQQLPDAAAWLESLGNTHGDISPRNILFKDESQPNLVYFDYALKIGDDLDVGYELYVWSLRRGQVGEDYSIAGPVTEQLTIGLTFWFMTQETELYHELDWPEKMTHLINCTVHSQIQTPKI